MAERYPKPWRLHPDDFHSGKWLIAAANDRVVVSNTNKTVAQMIIRLMNKADD